MVAQPTNKKKAWPRTGTGAGTDTGGGAWWLRHPCVWRDGFLLNGGWSRKRVSHVKPPQPGAAVYLCHNFRPAIINNFYLFCLSVSSAHTLASSPPPHTPASRAPCPHSPAIPLLGKRKKGAGWLAVAPPQATALNTEERRQNATASRCLAEFAFLLAWAARRTTISTTVLPAPARSVCVFGVLYQ